MSMRRAPQPSPSEPLRPRATRWIPLALVGATLAAYSNSFSAPLLFDDLPSIVENPQIRGIEALWRVFEDSGRGDITLAGRPVGAWSFALNHALGGLEVWGYHALNLVIHCAAGLVLFALLRRTLELERLRERWGVRAAPIAAFAAALFLLHPLQTKAVTFVVQRLESLAALCLLLVLYGLLRAAGDAVRARRWLAGSALACALGMGVKETLACAPLLALLYDRAFLAGSWRAAWSARRGYYLALACTWIVLAALVLLHPRWSVASAAAEELGRLDYLLLQLGAFGHYLRQIAWPDALVFDYGIYGDGVAAADFSARWWASAVLCVALIGATLAGLARNRAWAVLGAAAFGVLAPSSSLVPIRLDPLAEHRLYLPLAVLALLAALALDAFARRVAAAQAQRYFGAVAVLLSAAAGFFTHVRNSDYASARSIWQDTVDKRPSSARALTNLGVEVLVAGDAQRALELHEAAIAARPSYAEAHHNRGNALLALQSNEAALASFERALELEPGNLESLVGAGEALVRLGRNEEAAAHFERALARAPGLLGAHRRMAGIRAGQGRTDNALQHLQAALALDGGDPLLWVLSGSLQAERGRYDLARANFEQALRIDPGHVEARARLERLRALLSGQPDPRTGQQR